MAKWIEKQEYEHNEAMLVVGRKITGTAAIVANIPGWIGIIVEGNGLNRIILLEPVLVMVN